MKRQHSVPLLIVALLSLLLSTTNAVPQTKTSATTPSKKSSSGVAKTIPAIKCTTPDSMVACKSFKELVDARDKGLLDSLTGGRNSRERHFAYVCLWAKQDTFKIVEFDEPLPAEFLRFSPPSSNDLSVFLNKQSAFPYAKGKPVMALGDAQDKWFNDHNDYSVYSFGTIYVESWENGILADYVTDSGKWQRPLPQGHSNEYATFESAHQWLEHFNKENDDKLATVDDLERPRVVIDNTSIYVHYHYKNKNNDFTDYTLTIQRSTGRFKESFVAPGLDPFDDSGTCMSFKY